MRFKHESDIRWLLDGSADAALGQKSAHASFIARLEGSTGNSATDESDLQDRLCESAARQRRLREVYERCSHRTQRVLAAWARPDRRSKHWKDLTHVLPMLGEYDPAKHGGRANESLETRLSVGEASDRQKAAELMLRRGAETAVADAMAEYERVHDTGTGRTRTSGTRRGRRCGGRSR